MLSCFRASPLALQPLIREIRASDLWLATIEFVSFAVAPLLTLHILQNCSSKWFEPWSQTAASLLFCLFLARLWLGTPSLQAPSFHTTIHNAIPPFQQVDLMKTDSQSPSIFPWLHASVHLLHAVFESGLSIQWIASYQEDTEPLKLSTSVEYLVPFRFVGPPTKFVRFVGPPTKFVGPPTQFCRRSYKNKVGHPTNLCRRSLSGI